MWWAHGMAQQYTQVAFVMITNCSKYQGHNTHATYVYSAKICLSFKIALQGRQLCFWYAHAQQLFWGLKFEPKSDSALRQISSFFWHSTYTCTCRCRCSVYFVPFSPKNWGYRDCACTCSLDSTYTDWVWLLGASRCCVCPHDITFQLHL